MRFPLALAVGLLALTTPTHAQTVTVIADCDVTSVAARTRADGRKQVTLACTPAPGQTIRVGDKARITRTTTTPPPVTPAISAFNADPSTVEAGKPSLLKYTYTPAGAAFGIQGVCGLQTSGTALAACGATQQEVRPAATTMYQAQMSATVIKHVTVTVTPTVPPVEPPVEPTDPLYGAVDPASLGTCSAAVHDTYWVRVGAKRYRTWHPQVDKTGCVYGHEHGDDPMTSGNAEIRARGPVPFGLIVDKTPGHPTEPHHGYKCFVEDPGSVNDENRVNLVYSRSCFHMGTSGPARFSQQHHSADIALVHPQGPLKAFTQLMMDTGGTNTVCDPRAQAPTKDALVLGEPCLNPNGTFRGSDSFYEIWSTQQAVQFQGRTVYLAFATPAVFDVITIFNRKAPTETVYAWDPRVDSLLRFPGNPRDFHRGCDRESYAQPGYWYNAASNAAKRTIYWTNSMGQEVPETDPLALQQTISVSDSVGIDATNDGLKQFKSRPRRWCRSGLSLLN